jgi:hypothetical protein|tara:strand:- start:42 stop:206 length:165 start_codon:yes stop_codon:yes gene_type:complete
MEERQFLANMLQIIDVATKRGAWNGSELETVAISRKAITERLSNLEDTEEEAEE